MNKGEQLKFEKIGEHINALTLQMSTVISNQNRIIKKLEGNGQPGIFDRVITLETTQHECQIKMKEEKNAFRWGFGAIILVSQIVIAIIMKTI